MEEFRLAAEDRSLYLIAVPVGAVLYGTHHAVQVIIALGCNEHLTLSAGVLI